MNISVNTFNQRNALKEKILNEWNANRQDKRTIVIFLFLGTFFTILGIVLAINGSEVTEFTQNYSDEVTCVQGSTCTITMHITEYLEQPVYFYFQMNNFYQNHRQYVLSSEMARYYDTSDDTTNQKACYPYETNADIGFNTSVVGTPLVPDADAIPCGLAAQTLFNDTYIMTNEAGEVIYLNESSITWESHYGGEAYKEVNLTLQWTNLTDERFINWVRLACISQFRKVWARIDDDLAVGYYNIVITNNWNNSEYQADLYVVVGTVNSLGNKNILLTASYFTAALISWVIVIVFIVRLIRSKHKRRDKEKKDKENKEKEKDKDKNKERDLDE